MVGSVTDTELHFDSDGNKGGGGVLVWACIIKDELVGPLRGENGTKINSQTLSTSSGTANVCIFREDFDFYARQRSNTCIKVIHCVAGQ